MTLIRGLGVLKWGKHRRQQIIPSRFRTICPIGPIPLATRKIAPIMATRIVAQAEAEAVVRVGNIAAIRVAMEAIVAIQVEMEVTLGIVGIRATESTQEIADIRVVTVVALHLEIIGPVIMSAKRL